MPQIESVAQELLKKDKIDVEDMERLIGKRPFKEERTYKELLYKDDAEVEAEIASPDTEVNADKEDKEEK